MSIFVREYESKKVAVSGAVKRPGTYEMLGQKTLLEMISLAGGLDTDFGEEIVIFRHGENGATEPIRVDLEGLIYRADPSLNYMIEARDIIYVPAVENIRIFVSGAVRTPNLYEIPRFCESADRWQSPHGGFSRALFDANVTGARDHLTDLWPGRRARRSA